MTRIIFSLFAFVFTLGLIFVPFNVKAEQTTPAKQALVLDYETGQILFEKNADQRMPTSSMSKVMTTYMVFDALKDGLLTMDTKLKVSEKAWRKGGSKMFVEVNKEIKVKDLLRGVIVQSGNDATIVLAEGLYGSEEAFAKKMTAKALEIGMENSNFVNASGWPDKGHYSTAKDLAVMARQMIETFPEYYPIFSETEFTYNDIKQQNRNPLLYRDIGADGLKTGHTEIAGYGLIGTAKKDGRRVTMVVNGLESEKQRADEAVRLIEWGLNNFVNVDIAKSADSLGEADVAMGKAQKVKIGVEQDIKITAPRMEQKNITLDLNYNAPLIAPIKAGTEIGTVIVNIPTMKPQTYKLTAQGDVERVGFFKEYFNKAKSLITGAI